MPDATALDQATTMIEKAWGRPIEALESIAVRSPCDGPLLHSVMRIRASLVVTDNAVAVRQDRLHALTRSDRVPAFYDLERITASATGLRVAQAESRTSLQAISHVTEARADAATAVQAPAARLAQAAIARSGHAPRPRGQAPGQPAPSAVSSPSVGVLGPHR